jgi:hypothetical protein
MQYVVYDREGIGPREATERKGGSPVEDVVEATGPFDVTRIDGLRGEIRPVVEESGPAVCGCAEVREAEAPIVSDRVCVDAAAAQAVDLQAGYTRAGTGGSSEPVEARASERGVENETGLDRELAVRAVPVQGKQERQPTRCGATTCINSRRSWCASRTSRTSPSWRYRRPPWMSFEEALDVPAPKSPRSTSATARPARAASAAIPAPMIPPPMTSRSNLRLPSCSIDSPRVVIGYSSCSRMLVAAARAV